MQPNQERTYAIGDVQGCLAPLKQLLKKVNYRPHQDTLWFTGDLVNRGPEPLETLRYIHSLPKTVCVLGNHDLILLALSHYEMAAHPSDTHQAILSAPDKDKLLDWLQHCPLLHHDPISGYTMTHAGIFPLWDLTQAKTYAHEVETMLQSPSAPIFFKNMLGNHPSRWSTSLEGWERLRFITNAFTRMRFCTSEGELELTLKEGLLPQTQPIPWFAFPNRRTQQDKLIFGHWAALEGKTDVPYVYALDTGCVWGKCLTAFCLETQERFVTDCQPYIKHGLSMCNDK